MVRITLIIDDKELVPIRPIIHESVMELNLGSGGSTSESRMGRGNHKTLEMAEAIAQKVLDS
jgi:hypothetical protein